MKPSHRIGLGILVMGPIWVLYFFGYLSSLDIYRNGSYGFANLAASVLLWILCTFVSVVSLTRLNDDYQHNKKLRKAKEKKMLDLLTK